MKIYVLVNFYYFQRQDSTDVRSFSENSRSSSSLANFTIFWGSICPLIIPLGIRPDIRYMQYVTAGVKKSVITRKKPSSQS